MKGRVDSVAGEELGMLVEDVDREGYRDRGRVISVTGEGLGMFVKDVGREWQRDERQGS